MYSSKFHQLSDQYFFKISLNKIQHLIVFFSVSASSIDSTFSGSKSRYKKVLSIPMNMSCFLMIIIGAAIWAFLDPILEVFLDIYGVTAQGVGLLLLLMTGSYAITCLLDSLFVEKLNEKNKYFLMIFGILTSCIGLTILAPSEGITWKMILGLIIIGISIANIFVPSFEYIYHVCMKQGIEDNIATYSSVAALWNTTCSFG